jgi:hypothetical protein
MKKIFFNSVLVLFMCINASAISYSAGLKGGLAFSNMWGNYILQLDNNIENIGGTITGKTGYSGYLVFNTDLNEYFGIETDIGFSIKGRSIKLDDSTSTNKTDYNALYLEVPLLFKGSKSMGIVTPFVYYGPTFGFMLSSEEHISKSANNGTFNVDSTSSLKDISQTFDVGVTMGGGIEINAGPGSIVTDARFNISCTKVDKVIDPAIRSIARDDKFWNFNVLLGYLIKF